MLVDPENERGFKVMECKITFFLENKNKDYFRCPTLSPM